MHTEALHKLSWDWIKTFVAVAEHGSVATAALHLQTNAATVSRQITALEQHFGAELFVRSRQGMQPTQSAIQFLGPAQAMAQAMLQLGVGAAALDEALQGVVRISASVSFANHVLPDMLSLLHSQQPGIRFEVIATDSYSNLVKREADIAIRLANPVQPELIARRVAYFSIGLYASTAYLARRGIPKTDITHLMQHDFLDVAPQQPMLEGFSKMGFPQLQSRIVSLASDHTCAWHMVKAGMGIGSSFRVVAERDRDMKQVMHDVQIPPLPVWMVTHRELRLQPRLRLVYDYLAQAIGALAKI